MPYHGHREGRVDKSHGRDLKEGKEDAHTGQFNEDPQNPLQGSPGRLGAFAFFRSGQRPLPRPALDAERVEDTVRHISVIQADVSGRHVFEPSFFSLN